MRTSILTVGAWAILVASLCAGDQGPVGAESSHAQQIEAFLKAYPKAAPLIVIKDGKGDFSNWERFNAEVIDGDHVHVRNTNPRTKREFTDFKLVFEFKMDPGANSGIFLRDLGELRMLENTAEKYKKLDPRQYHGSAYGLAPAKRGFQKPIGEWNYQEVVVRGHTIVVHLNGTKILDTDLFSKIAVDMKNKKYKPSTKLKGRLRLGGHARGVYYRNMYAADLTQDETPPSPKGELGSQYNALTSDLENRRRFKLYASQTYRKEAMVLDSDRDPTDIVMRRTRSLYNYLQGMGPISGLDELGRQLSTLEDRGNSVAVSDISARYAVYEEACRLRRKIAFKNPLLDFDKILFIMRHRSRSNHMCDQYYGSNQPEGGGLYVLSNPFGEKPEIRDVLARSVVKRGRRGMA